MTTSSIPMLNKKDYISIYVVVMVNSVSRDITYKIASACPKTYNGFDWHNITITTSKHKFVKVSFV